MVPVWYRYNTGTKLFWGKTDGFSRNRSALRWALFVRQTVSLLTGRANAFAPTCSGPHPRLVQSLLVDANMSYPSSLPTLSRSSSQIRTELLHDYKPFEPWCLLLSESQPAVAMVQVPLMNPETCSKELVCPSVLDNCSELIPSFLVATPSCSCMGPEKS